MPAVLHMTYFPVPGAVRDDYNLPADPMRQLLRALAQADGRLRIWCE
jgi:hypothetical protein